MFHFITALWARLTASSFEGLVWVCTTARFHIVWLEHRWSNRTLMAALIASLPSHPHFMQGADEGDTSGRAAAEEERPEADEEEDGPTEGDMAHSVACRGLGETVVAAFRSEGLEVSSGWLGLIGFGPAFLKQCGQGLSAHPLACMKDE